MSLHVYIAAKFIERDRVQVLRDAVLASGHRITFDWTTSPEIDGLKPHDLYTEGACGGRELAERMIEGAESCDVFVYLDHPEMRGGLIELGAALSHQSIARKEVLWISPTGSTPFQDMEQIRPMKSEAEVVPFLRGFEAMCDFNEFADPKGLLENALKVPDLEKRVAQLEAKLATLDRASRAIAALTGGAT